MTSNAGAQECFVYITLPGATEFVTAGRFVLEPDRAGTCADLLRDLFDRQVAPQPCRTQVRAQAFDCLFDRVGRCLAQ